jgi:chromate transporter
VLREIALVFLKLGALSFGGPAAHVAMMEEELVRRRQWLDRQEFLDLLGATNLIPGPNSTEMAIHIGRRRGGWPGLLVAGACFILPAALIVLACAWAYVRFGTRPQAVALMYGMKPVALAVVAVALVGLARTALRGPAAIVVAAVAAALVVVGMHELLVLLLAGVAVAASRGFGPRATPLALALPPLAAAGTGFGLLPLFLVFLKIGAVLYGSGYVLLAFLRADLVERYRWLTEAQLLDAVAVGQITPGPLFTTATFIGYVLAGVPGAAVATAGIFLPAFVFVAMSGPLVPRLRRSPAAGAFLDGVNAASLALMAVVTVQLAGDALVDVTTVLLALASAAVLAATRVGSAWLMAGGALVGLAAAALR